MDYSGLFHVQTAVASGEVDAASSKHGVEIAQKQAGFVVTFECKLSQVQAMAQDVKSPIFMPILKA